MKQNNKKLYESIMKDVSKIIKKHLNENEIKYDSVQIEKNLEDCALSVIDFLNQEGDIKWDENTIIDYVNEVAILRAMKQYVQDLI